MRTRDQHGHKTRSDLKIGISGEPDSVKFCDRIELNDVACSPSHVPPIKTTDAVSAAFETAILRASSEVVGEWGQVRLGGDESVGRTPQRRSRLGCA